MDNVYDDVAMSLIGLGGIHGGFRRPGCIIIYKVLFLQFPGLE